MNEDKRKLVLEALEGLAVTAEKDQGGNPAKEWVEQVERLKGILSGEVTETPDPFQAAIKGALKLKGESKNGEAVACLERAVNPVRPAKAWENEPEPAPVLWRDPGQNDSVNRPDCVLSVGEVAILASAGGLGKSFLTLEVAAAAILSGKEGGDYGCACGLRVRPGPVVMVNYEDHPVRIARRVNDGEAMGGIHLWPDPLPLWQAAGEKGGESAPCPQWAALWQAVRQVKPALVVIDPVSAALADLSTSETGPVRAFLRALNREAAAAQTGVLLVAHDTKSARNEAQAGGAPGAGAVAGSAAWYDGARGVLYLRADATDRTQRVLHCIKANHGLRDWGAVLVERRNSKGWFTGFQWQESMDPREVDDWLKTQKPEPAPAAKGRKKKPDGKAGASSGGRPTWDNPPR